MSWLGVPGGALVVVFLIFLLGQAGESYELLDYEELASYENLSNANESGVPVSSIYKNSCSIEI